MDRVGIRELRQNLSIYLRRIEQGETLEVTDRGRPVATLAPLPPPTTARDRLIAAGQIIPATATIAELGPALAAPSGRSVSDALESEREDSF